MSPQTFDRVPPLPVAIMIDRRGPLRGPPTWLELMCNGKLYKIATYLTGWSMRNIIVSGLLAGLICLAGAGCSSESRGSTGGGGGKKKGKGGEGGPVPVTVAKVAQKTVPVDVQVVGNA